MLSYSPETGTVHLRSLNPPPGDDGQWISCTFNDSFALDLKTLQTNEQYFQLNRPITLEACFVISGRC